jgi:hypothetical protein
MSDFDFVPEAYDEEPPQNNDPYSSMPEPETEDALALVNFYVCCVIVDFTAYVEVTVS